MGLPVVSTAVLERGTKRALIESQQQAPRSYVGVFARRAPSDGRSEKYPWLSQAPIMKLLEDMLEAAQLSDATLEVENDTYAISLEVGRDDLNDDQLAAIMQRVREMTDIAMQFGNQLLMTALKNATSEGGYDGVSFYNDAHPIRGLESSAFDNLFAGTGTTVSAIQTDMSTLITGLARAEGENGQPLVQERSRWVVNIPPDLRANMHTALFGQIAPEVIQNVAGSENVGAASISNNKFPGMRFTVIDDARLTDTNDWYGHDVTLESRMPLGYQEREGVETEVLGPGSDYYVTRERALFKVRWRGATFYGHHGHSGKMVNT